MNEPTIDQMREALGDQSEAFAFGWTIRRCRVCGDPTPGGPTLCERCGKLPMSGADIASMENAWKVKA